MEPDPLSSTVILSSLNITFFQISVASVFGIILNVILLICSALISGSEVAFFSLSPRDIQKINNGNSGSDKSAAELIKKPKELLATILISNNFINIGIVILSTHVVNSLVDFSNSPVIGFIIQVVGITFLLLLFGEIIPKIYANEYSYRFVRLMSKPLKILQKFFKPISYFLISTTKVIDKRVQKKSKISIDELSDALELTSEELDEDKDILKGIIGFGNIDAHEIMRPRVDVLSIDIKTTFTKVIKEIVDAGYSRIPIYKETFDNVEGVLYIKDLLPHLQKDDSFNWQKLIRPPYFVPEKKKINDLLSELQKDKIHMAIVVDEYGGTCGIITMEDIIEEIVGDFTDEFDDDEINYSKINENSFLFDGKTLLNDFYKITETNNSVFDEIKGDAETLGGMILELKGEFPNIYDKINYKNFTFTIEELDKRRIVKIKTTINR